MTFLSTELATKRLEILKEIAPTVSRVAVLWNPERRRTSSRLSARWLTSRSKRSSSSRIP